jgi:23S rRNA maturation mini-RNase III
MSTPSSDETESIGDDADADLRRMRRSFVVLLRALAEDDVSKKSGTAITQLEKQARREVNAKFQTNDMANRVPEGLETPTYSVLASRSGYEIRLYEPFTVCSVAMNKSRPAESSKTDAKISNPQLKGASAFGALAGYLFGKNSESTAMKMTTPVLSVGEGAERYMSFVLPSKFWNGLDTAPKPLENSGVVLEKKDGGNRAAVMFGGFAATKNVEERTKQLLDGLAKDAEWTAERGASVTLAQYNDPFTPPWKRRNEVSIEVVRHQDN